ncbi:hypothetical protein JTE90_008929 [Oedothorax gibbosus]|uniref:N-acetyltransferase domain-containing protein n=1 Tax=Oedothorax gibbosus TaxID=931172 RepID=A0AAV6UMX9_9ARAC|nr:hypothetical protein JTE90_008929 [Oedothorax gibbosus]
MSDAPAHHIFCLCGPPKEQKAKSKRPELPEVLCVLQVCLEGKLSEKTVKHELSHGRRGAGDLIPWTISQEFTQQDFPSLSGARIVRIATHPDYQGKGYGLLALKLLQDFYEGKFYHSEGTSVNMAPLVYNDIEMEENLEEKLASQTLLPTLFPSLNELKPDILDYLGVSYGVSEELLRFWKKAQFCPVYLGYTANQLTGEHSCIMLKQLTGISTSTNWLSSFAVDFCWKTIETILWLKLDADLALSLISQEKVPDEEYRSLSKLEISNLLEHDDLDNLKDFCNIPGFGLPLKENAIILSKLYFTRRFKDIHLTEIERRALFSYGILRKQLETVAESLQCTVQQTTTELLSGLKKLAVHIVEIST